MLDPADSAEDAGLRYVTDAEPGIRRRRAGHGFTYIGPGGRRLTDQARLDWIRSLAIPPAWTDVWICPSRLGHLQATGRDARGRKQYRYHPRWRAQRDDVKYERLIAFGDALPRIRRRVDRDLRRSGLPRERVLAAVVRLLERTQVRVGNAEYARENRSYGLTTLRDRHARVGSKRIRFRFREFRTWTATVLAASALREIGHADSLARARRNVLRAMERVAERLGDTAAVTRGAYVHPDVIAAYLDGDVARVARRPGGEGLAVPNRDLAPHESAVLALLRRQAADEPGRQAASIRRRARR